MAAARFGSYVATGDSFTEGMDDPRGDGTYRGWADLVAERLAADVPDFRYANLAVRGRRLDAVVTEQVPAALAMRPDLVSFSAGGNDALRRTFDVGQLAATYEEAVRRLRATGAAVVLFTWVDLTIHLPASGYLGPRMTALNAVARRVAETHGAVLVELWDDPAFADSRLWSIDRLHLNEAGHRRVAAHVLAALGVPPDDGWLADLPPLPPARWLAARRADLRWARTHLAPWLGRRLTGRSSGDQVAPKRPTLTPYR